MDEQIFVFIKGLVLIICITVAVGQCPVHFKCPAGQICAMARQDYGPAIPECINSGGVDATLLDQAMQGGLAGPGTGTDRFTLNHYRRSRYGSGLFGTQYRGFHDPYARNRWGPMAGTSRYPVRRYMYPLGFGRPLRTFSGHAPLVFPGFQNGKIGFRPNLVKDTAKPIRLNVTVDNSNNNVLEQNGSSNVKVKQEAKQSVTPTPLVNQKGPVIPLHPGPLVPVQIHDIHDIHDPGHQAKIPSPVVDPPVGPIEEHGNQGIPLGFAKPRVV